MAITDAWLRSIKGKAYKGKAEITYRDGVGVRISPKGKVTWVYRVSFKGKAIKMKLGEYPAMKISDALNEGKARADLVAEGIDPRKSLMTKRQELPQTLDDIIEYWLEHHAKENVKQWNALYKMFLTDISPYLGHYPIKQLELVDFMPVFQKAKQRVSPKHSANLMSRLKQVISFGVRHGLVTHNPIGALKKRDVGLPSEPKRSKQSEAAVPVLWKAIDELSIHESNKNFLRLLAIFVNRANELRLARKKDFDLVEKIWIIPKENNKNMKKGGGMIRHPIPDLALDVINSQFKLWPNFEVMFPPVNVKKDRPMSKNTPVDFGGNLGNMMVKLGYPRTTNHDMRRTARNIWEAKGVPYHVAETMLGHKVHTGVQSHYLDYDYLDEQREAYEMWAKILQPDS